MEKQLFASYLTEGELKHYAELTQALFAVSGVADEKQKSRIREIFSSENDLVTITMGSSIHKYEALLEDENYREFVFADIAKRWGDMLFAGATSFWETFSGDDEFTFGGATSLCHGWAALPIYLYYKYGRDIV